MANIVEESNGILMNRIIRLMPVPRRGQMIEDENHVGYWRYNGTKLRFVLPKSRARHTLYPLLTAEEQAFFEKKLGLDLNLYKKVDNFWYTFEVVIEKTDLLMKEGLKLNLADPMDNLKWRLLKIQPMIAPSWEEAYDSGEYILALVDEHKEVVDRSVKANLVENAYKYLLSISGSQMKLYDFLSIYWLQNPKAKRPDKSTAIDLLKEQAQDIVAKDLKGFLAIAQDPDYDVKLLIHRGISLGAIDKRINSKEYLTPEGRFLGSSLEQTIKNLQAGDYQDDYLRIKAVVDATLEDPAVTLKSRKTTKE